MDSPAVRASAGATPAADSTARIAEAARSLAAKASATDPRRALATSCTRITSGAAVARPAPDTLINDIPCPPSVPVIG